MLEKYKPGITLFGILAVIAILFPPVVREDRFQILDSGFTFLFNMSGYAGYWVRINISKLLVELILVFIIALIFQVNYEKIKKFFEPYR